jgi:hypothetical protein
VTVLPGQNFDSGITVPTSAGNAPLTPGGYVLELSLTAAGRKNEAEVSGPGAVMNIPVRVGDPPAWGFTVLRSDLPTTVEAGSVYDVHATLRNDGAATWHKSARIGIVLTKLDQIDDASTGGGSVETAVATPDASVDLAQDVAPGQEVDVHFLLPFTDPAGKPLPVWTQDQLWTYAARWQVTDAEGPIAKTASLAESPAPGALSDPEPICVSPFDFGVKFTADGTPPTLPGDHRLPVRISLENTGPQTWKKQQVRIGYHWYYQDGTEYVWEDETTPLTDDVPPGGRVSDMLAWVTAPPYDGTYWLVWDVKVGDTWGSTTASARVLDESVRSVQVTGGRLKFADLTTAYTLAGSTPDDALSSGDFDGRGDSFPTDQFPPFASGEIAPATMWAPDLRTGPESPRHISFRFGPKGAGDKNFIACNGQTIELGSSSGQCRLLHILAASTGDDALTSIKLIFQEPTSRSEDDYALQVSRWDGPPSHGEELGYLAYGHHTKDGLQPGAVALYHYVIRIRDPRKLVAIGLPNKPDIKIAALTLEK